MSVVTNKLDIYTALAHNTAKRMAGNSREWMKFLMTSSRFYKYSFLDQVLIYAQRPDATACAGFELWKTQMGRYIRGGSRGIGLVYRSHGGAATVQYVFDVKDTGEGKDGRRPFLWRYRPEHFIAVAEALHKRFEVPMDENLAGQLVRVAVQLADDYWQGFSRSIKRDMQNSMAGEYDEDNLRIVFRNTVVVSASYALLSRCGMNLDEIFGEEDFRSLVEFDSPEALTALGEAVSTIAGEILRVIEDAIRKQELKKLLAWSAEDQAASIPEPTIKASETANAPTSPAPDAPMKEMEPEAEPSAQNTAELLQPHTEQPETDIATPVEEMRTADIAETPVEKAQPEAAAEVSVEETQTADIEEENSDLPIFLSWNYHITDDNLGAGGEKAKYQYNVAAIRVLKQLESKGFPATLEEQEILSRYVGWGGIPDAFNPDKAEWAREYGELRELLTEEEYASARASVLNAHYTSPTVIRAIYDAIDKMGFKSGNILEPAMGIGNFFGCLPETMQDSKLYGVEIDSISGRIAKLLYPKARIDICGYEKTNFPGDFFDLAVGNVPFGDYGVNDQAYDKLGFSIHNYFLAKAIDQLRPGGIAAFVTSRYTMDAKDPKARKYLAERADLIGAIRLPNNAFKLNAGTDVVADVVFLQKRETPLAELPEWAEAAESQDGYAVNRYFQAHPEMVLGIEATESTRYGEDYTVLPAAGADLAVQLNEAISRIHGRYHAAVAAELEPEETAGETIPADPNVKNYSYTVVEGKVYYRENSVMVKTELNSTAEARVKGMVELRDCVNRLIEIQMSEDGETEIHAAQQELNALYDAYTKDYGLINSRANRLAFDKDSSYYLLCSLEILDEDGNLERKADMFSKRTIRQHKPATHVDTAAEALVVSIGERACVDLSFMASLTGKLETELVSDLQGVIYKDPQAADNLLEGWQTADEYLSGNVRRKLRVARAAATKDPAFQANVEALESAQPRDLEASEIEVRLGATWVDQRYYQQFMFEILHTPVYLRNVVTIRYASVTAEWFIENKSRIPGNDITAHSTYGTGRASAYHILEDSLNLRDMRIYDTVTDPDGRERRVLNTKETTLAAQKQQALRDAFRTWIFNDPERRRQLVALYNEKFNSIKPREFDGRHITFPGMNPAIKLQPHQVNAIAHVLYGGNTLLAHEVGAGKTFEMIAAAMESKRLGLCHKSIFVVPNHLTEQSASEFLRLYPAASILVTTKRDFETAKRKKFCARIATGDYDAIIIGHSQFERIPVSMERQERLLQEQIDSITDGIIEVKASGGERFTIKQLERMRKGLQAKLEKLQAAHRKDDVVTFEQLGVDQMFVDESDNYKNLFLYTKMRNVAGIAQTEAQKSSDMFAKCRYLDEITGCRGTVFATGTPISNSVTEMYTIQRYLQYDRLQEMGMAHFDCWASHFGETTTSLELAPEGTGYRARTRFAKFFNLPELMNIFKEVADIKTADQLCLPTPEVEYHTIVSSPTKHQKAMVEELSKRAAKVHSGSVDPHVDNMLRITSDGRKLGLDQRILNPVLLDEAETKVNKCVENVLKCWRDGEADRLTQLIFSDISTPQAKSAVEEGYGFSNIYNDIRAKLISGGMPPEQVAFIHEADTDVQKKELFAKVRSGQIRVLIGSTQKMGAGTNVQDRLIALHDLDCPWRPRDLTQRAGRIVRRGNTNAKVHIYRYVTEATFDAYLWQTIENKQKFISQIMTSKSPVRSCEDVDEAALSYAEIKALCAGDPRIKERMELDTDVARLKIMRADHQNQQYRLEDSVLVRFPAQIAETEKAIEALEADMETLSKHPHPVDGFAGMTVNGTAYDARAEAGLALLDACADITENAYTEIGSYRGLVIFAAFSGVQHVLTLKNAGSYRVEVGPDPRGNITRIDNALADTPDRLERHQTQLANLQQQMEAAKAESGKPFPREEELQRKLARLAELDAQLNIGGQAGAETAA